MNIIKTDAGNISGTVVGKPGNEVSVFRGIPYATPPLGDLRWKPPQPVIPWSGVRECIEFSAAAPQTNIAGLNLLGNIPPSEDCLYLNVWSPAKEANDKLPVMVWMHGGGYVSGTGNTEIGLTLPLQGAVLVTVNMRLGPLGCLAHPLLSRESPNGVSGNYLFLDMVSALQWVQKNISAFGGDPDNITIFGESGGSSKVINLMASPLAKGLFHQAIGESGGGLGAPLKEMETRGEKIFAQLDIDKEKDPLVAARALPWQNLIDTCMKLTAESNDPFVLWDSAVDGWFLTDSIADTFKTGKQNTVPFIMGANLGELTGPGMITMPGVIPMYVNMFEGAIKVNGKAYGYIFDHIPATWRKEGSVAAHAMEIPYVFGEMDSNNELWLMVYNVAKPAGAKSPDPGLTEVDKKVSELMVQMWANFAKTGNPSIEGLVDWPAWDEEKDQYLYITDKPETREGFSKVI